MQCSIQYIEELMFSGVNMRRRLGTAFHIGKYQIENAASVFAGCQLSAQDAFVPSEYIHGRRMFKRISLVISLFILSPDHLLKCRDCSSDGQRLNSPPGAETMPRYRSDAGCAAF
jgi:hypothetical protein